MDISVANVLNENKIILLPHNKVTSTLLIH